MSITDDIVLGPTPGESIHEIAAYCIAISPATVLPETSSTPAHDTIGAAAVAALTASPARELPAPLPWES